MTLRNRAAAALTLTYITIGATLLLPADTLSDHYPRTQSDSAAAGSPISASPWLPIHHTGPLSLGHGPRVGWPTPVTRAARR